MNIYNLGFQITLLITINFLISIVNCSTITIILQFKTATS